MVAKAPSKKPVISTYPIPCRMDDHVRAWQSTPGVRMCDPIFSQNAGEGNMIRLGGSARLDSVSNGHPRWASFIAAGFYFVSASFLKEVPFDPLLPWVFM